MIGIGSIVTCNGFGPTAWVVYRRAGDQHWRVMSKTSDGFGHAFFTARTAGEGDLTEIEPPPTYQIGDEISYGGKVHVVLSDDGDLVVMSVPETSYPLPRGGALKIPAGNTAVISKADLVLEALE